MLKQIVNRMQGQVRVRVESKFPERVLNLCGARGLSFWNVERESSEVMYCTLTRQDYHRLLKSAAELDADITPERKQGAPFFLKRFRRRRVLLGGLCLVAALLFLSSFFIWSFEIEGNETVSKQRIMRVLADNGVKPGVFGLSVDGPDLRNRVLLEIPELSWIAVNVSGYLAHVQVRERIPAPELVDRETPTNVVATQDGVVLKVSALDGQAMVLPGTTVEEGQILIAGVVDTDTFGARIVAGMGTVTARTWHKLITKMPLIVEQKAYTEKPNYRYALTIGTNRFKFYGKSGTDGVNCDKIKETFCAPMRLPIRLERESRRDYETVLETVPESVAKERAEAILQERLRARMGEDDEIVSTLCTTKREGDVLTVTLTAECHQQIGKSVKIVDETAESPETDDSEANPTGQA